jgi:hypothetical protein
MARLGDTNFKLNNEAKASLMDELVAAETQARADLVEIHLLESVIGSTQDEAIEQIHRILEASVKAATRVVSPPADWRELYPEAFEALDEIESHPFVLATDDDGNPTFPVVHARYEALKAETPVDCLREWSKKPVREVRELALARVANELATFEANVAAREVLLADQHVTLFYEHAVNPNTPAPKPVVVKPTMPEPMVVAPAGRHPMSEAGTSLTRFSETVHAAGKRMPEVNFAIVNGIGGVNAYLADDTVFFPTNDRTRLEALIRSYL